MPETILAVYRDPFSLGSPTTMRVPPGTSLAGFVKKMPGLPKSFAETGECRIDGLPIPRELWGRVRPKPARDGQPISVTLHMPLRGGGEQGGKSSVALIGAIIIAAAATAISAGALAPLGATLGFSLAAGSTGAILASSLVSPPAGAALAALAPEGGSP